ncbi:DUF234 domain-containing protein [Phascolarctobacterium succinatutens]|uniref:DUF234 domain-containing protein n=1 Tax=Phascolarctobacterium succinatutens TaxID=626940 RepID=UPI003AF92C10
MESGDAGEIYQYVVKPELERFTSYVFEDVCQQYLRKQNRKHDLPFYFTKIGRWWNKTDEIDIMAVDYRQTQILLGECKYKHRSVDVKDLKHFLMTAHLPRLTLMLNRLTVRLRLLPASEQ